MGHVYFVMIAFPSLHRDKMLYFSAYKLLLTLYLMIWADTQAYTKPNPRLVIFSVVAVAMSHAGM